MKKVLFSLITMMLTVNLLAQNPVEHHAVIHKTNGDLVKNKEIDMQINVYQSLSDSLPTYFEKQSLTTNMNGVVTIELFADTMNNDFSTINWTQTYFIKIETNPEFVASVIFKKSVADTNNRNYCFMETDPVYSTSVAAGLSKSDTIKWNNKLDSYSEIDPVFNNSLASKICSEDTMEWNNKQDRLSTGIGLELIDNTISAKNDFYLGQDTLGGIVYYIFIGSDGRQHGLIVSKIEGFELKWQDTCTLTNGIRTWDGAYNTDLMIYSPAKDWVNDNFTLEWYLPSIDELNILWDNRIHVNKVLNKLRKPLLSNIDGYWSSTELNEKRAFTNSISYGIGDIGKTNIYYVRAVRAF
jgi:hypothetical protein